MKNPSLGVLIVDDEPKAQKLIVQLLKEHYKEINILGVAANIADAKHLIGSKKPNLVFLDINLPPGNSFELLQQLPELNFEVIFVTNFADYAIHAIKFAAVDYILKPVTKLELYEAVDKAWDRIKKDVRYDRLEHFVENLSNPFDSDQEIAFPLTNRRTANLKVSDIAYCNSEGDLTFVHVAQKKGVQKVPVNKGIGECEELLAPHHFYRTHRKHLINFAYVEDISKVQEAKVKLKGDLWIPVARRRKVAFLKAFNWYKKNMS